MKTYSAKPTDVTRKWYVIDASQAPLGRVCDGRLPIYLLARQSLNTQPTSTVETT
jgi:ribosomal protein L13